jgi:GNAT superfamily N-acetyltransferase
MSNNVSDYRADERLKDGRAVAVRAIRADDKERVKAAFQLLDAESIYTRLFAYKEELSEDDLRKLTEVDFTTQVALVVALASGKRETIIAGGRYFAFDGADGRRHAEVAFMVEEDYQGLGIAGMVLRHLAGIARSQGIVCFEAEVLPANRAMLRVFARSGLPMEQRSADDTIQVRMSLEQTNKAASGE